MQLDGAGAEAQGAETASPDLKPILTTTSEKKIDDMQESLASIETLLRDLTTGSGSTAGAIQAVAASLSAETDKLQRSTERATPSSSASRDDNDGSTIFDPEDAESFEGSSSLAAHAAFASELVSQAVQSNMLAAGTPYSAPNPRIEAALSSLRQMVDLQTTRQGMSGGEAPPQKTIHVGRGRLRDLPMPPMDFVIEKLRDLKGAPGPMMLLVVTCFTDIEDFTNRCRRLYFCTDDADFSESLFIIVNAGLMYLFFEGSVTAPAGSAEKARLERCCAMCQGNVEAALAHLPLLMPATLENVEALLMAASFAIDLSRPSLSWLLTSRAAHMCRTLGLHQESSVRNDPPEVRANKAILFWSTYMLDKGLSLRLGRASVLQDYDISVPSVLHQTHVQHPHGSPPSEAILSLWIKHAEVQGRIYQRLYSPGALRQSEAARSQQVQLVVKDLQFLLQETLRLMEDVRIHAKTREEKMFEIVLKSDEVSYYSSLALAFRALPPSGTGASFSFADECLDSARAAMKSHQEAMAMMDDKSLVIVYLHWTILYAPFIPFIVIFCHVIETSSTSDLQLLEHFILSLKDSCQISAAVDKLHRLSKVLYHVALLYVEAKTQQSLDQDMVPVGNEFDMYLSQLGFMPMDETMAGGLGDTAPDDMTRNLLQTTQLGDWFSGGNHIMGLVEEDLSTFNTSAW
ncbi:hypothetical protein JX266_012389 [Neoarthrinium moseri]|nr:hypothetical protein JX266_012389 [Neoarthrinium moseri]